MSMQVIIIITNLYQWFFWQSLVAIEALFIILTSVDLWPLWRSSASETYISDSSDHTKFGSHVTKFTIFDLWPPWRSSSFLACIRVLLTKYGSHSTQLTTLTSDDLWPPCSHHHLRLASVVLLTKFGSHSTLFNIFDPCGPRGPACATSKIQHVHLWPEPHPHTTYYQGRAYSSWEMLWTIFWINYTN